MSDRVVQAVNGAKKTSRQTLKPYQSVWLAHWKRTSCDAAGETGRPNASRNEELDSATGNVDLAKGLEDSSGSVKGLHAANAKTSEIGDDISKVSWKRVGNGGMLSSSFKDGQDTDDMQALRPEFAHNLERGKAVDCRSGIQFASLIPGIPATNGNPSRGRHSVGEGTSSEPPKWMKTDSARKDCMLTSNPLQETFEESSSHIVPYRFDIEKYEYDKGNAAVSVFSKRSRRASVRMLEHERCHENRPSTDSVCERKVYCLSQSNNSWDKRFWKSVACDQYLSTFGRGWFPDIQKCSGIRLFPSQSSPSEESEKKKSHNDYYTLLKLQNCAHDVETTRICTTVDALEGMPEGCPRFLQPTNGLLITKQTEVSACIKNDMVRTECHCVSPFFSQGKQQVILQPLNSLIDSNVEDNIRDEKAFKVTIKNESCAETDTMDIDYFKKTNSEKNLHSGPNSTTSTKAFNTESNISPWSPVAPSREVELGRLNNKLPYINLELPILPVAASSSENTHPSSSKTQSQEMNKVLEHVEQPKSKSNLSLDDLHNADPGNRWVKRLKLSSSNSFAQVTKSSNFASSSSFQEKKTKLSSEVPKSGTTRSGPTLRKQHGEKPVPSDKSGDFSRKDEDHLMENPRGKGKALLLSHAWVKRWLHNRRGITETKPEMEVVCEPQSSKLSLKKLQKEQFPSIAAMALMAKAFTCLQPCELQKSGSFTIWNTKTF